MASTQGERPTVAIIGSPNVGKSTLFNRLIGRRRSITDATPGVTRDAVEAVVRIGDRECLLVDTGGFSLVEDDAFAPQVARRSLEVAERADVIVMVLDVARLNADDREFIERLRPMQDRIVLAVNKVDADSREADAWNLLSLGFSRVVSISAAHGRNIDRLREEILAVLPPPGTAAIRQAPAIRLSIMGKPNTGKSTLLNRLLGEERALVTDVPGTTRDVVEGQFRYRDRTIAVVDTAGIRRKGKVRDSVEYYSVNRAIGTIRDSEVILLVVDAVEGLADQDKKIAQLAVREGRGVVLVLNKWDLMSDVQNRLTAVVDRIRFQFPVLDFAPVMAISAERGSGVEQLLAKVVGVHEQLNRRVATPRLNQALTRWTAENPPSGRHNVKLRYATQTSSNPLKFCFFANRSEGLPEAYTRYLVGKLRESFGLDSVPIAVSIRVKGD